MRRSANSIFTVGKAAYYIGLLLLFNFFFGLMFLRFFVWLIAGGILLALLLWVMRIGKKMIFGAAPKAEFSSSDARPKGRTSGGYSDAIDVEAEVYDEGK